MQCPFCKVDNDRVVDSRVIGEGSSIRRRRKCLECDRRFTTYERIETSPRLVVKKDQRREFFNRDKILAGLRVACQKRDISESQIDALVGQVESDVFERYDNEVSTRAIGEYVSRRLRKLDSIAFVRFASVYREFHAVEQFAPLLSAVSAGADDDYYADDASAGGASNGSGPGANGGPGLDGFGGRLR